MNSSLKWPTFRSSHRCRTDFLPPAVRPNKSNRTLITSSHSSPEPVPLQPTSVRTYMSAIRNLHIELGYDYPCGPATSLFRVMREIGNAPGCQLHCPFYSDCATGSGFCTSDRQKTRVCSTLTLGFHGFLQCGELVNLTRDDIVLAADLSVLSVRIQNSKTE